MTHTFSQVVKIICNLSFFRCIIVENKPPMVKQYMVTISVYVRDLISAYCIILTPIDRATTVTST